MGLVVTDLLKFLKGIEIGETLSTMNEVNAMPEKVDRRVWKKRS